MFTPLHFACRPTHGAPRKIGNTNETEDSRRYAATPQRGLSQPAEHTTRAMSDGSHPQNGVGVGRFGGVIPPAICHQIHPAPPSSSLLGDPTFCPHPTLPDTNHVPTRSSPSMDLPPRRFTSAITTRSTNPDLSVPTGPCAACDPLGDWSQRPAYSQLRHDWSSPVASVDHVGSDMNPRSHQTLHGQPQEPNPTVSLRVTLSGTVRNASSETGSTLQAVLNASPAGWTLNCRLSHRTPLGRAERGPLAHASSTTALLDCRCEFSQDQPPPLSAFDQLNAPQIESACPADLVQDHRLL